MHIPSHSVHTAAHCNLQCTLQLYHPVHIQCTHTAAAITSLEHTAANLQCTLQPIFSAHCSQSSVHTAAMYSHVQLSAANLQCTLQLYHPVHTAATLSGSNTIQYIQCTFEPPQGKHIPLLAYLQSSQHTLMVDCSSP